MLTEKNISDKYKYCEFCGRTLPKHYEGTLCPTCQEAQLFRNVRDYIRANTVNEYEVAEHFHIPLRQIKEWIREGRIEYHEVNTASTISGMHCQRCGAPVSFGTLCPNCLKLMNTQNEIRTIHSQERDAGFRHPFFLRLCTSANYFLSVFKLHCFQIFIIRFKFDQQCLAFLFQNHIIICSIFVMRGIINHLDTLSLVL